MWRRVSVEVIVVAALAAAGCQNKPKTATAPPAQSVAPEQTAETAREQLQRVNPNTEVGTVLTVYHDLAAVSDVDVSKFNAGDPISFLDINLNDLTMGHVVKAVGTNLQVQFEPPAAGHREPKKGDLAIFMSGPIVRPAHPVGAEPPPGTPATEPVATPKPEVTPVPTPPAPTPTPATEPAKETPKDAPATPAEPPKDTPAPKDAPAKDAPATPIEPAKDAPKDAPAPKDTPAKDTPADNKDAPAKDAPAKDAPADSKDAPAKDAPAKDAPAKDTPDNPFKNADQKPDLNK